jgi:hypothetical protein
MRSGMRLLFAWAVVLAVVTAHAQSPAGQNQVSGTPWEKQKVQGRDEVLRDIENRAKANGERVVQDVRTVIYDYETTIYRLVIRIGKRYGMDTAYEIMSEGIVERRLRWLDQVMPELKLSGTEVEKGLALYRKYFGSSDDEFKVIELTKDKVVFKRKDYVNAIFHACEALGLDPITVNNKVYAGPMTLVLSKVVPGLKQTCLTYDGDGWYREMIEFSPPKK